MEALTVLRYFDDKAVDPPKRRTRGKGRVIKVRNAPENKTSDIHEPVHAKSDNGLCDICGHGRDSDRHDRRHGSAGNEGARE